MLQFQGSSKYRACCWTSLESLWISLFALKCSVKQYDDWNLDAVFETSWNRFLSGVQLVQKESMLPWRKSRVIGKEPKWHPLRDFLGSQMGSDSETSLEVSWVPENPGLWGSKASEFPDIFFPTEFCFFFGKWSKLHTWPLNLWVNGQMIKTKRQFSRMFHTAFFAEAVVCLMLVEWLLFVFFLFLWFLVVCCCCSYCYSCCRCCCRCAEIAQIVGCESCL